MAQFGGLNTHIASVVWDVLEYTKHSFNVVLEEPRSTQVSYSCVYVLTFRDVLHTKTLTKASTCSCIYMGNIHRKELSVIWEAVLAILTVLQFLLQKDKGIL